MGKTVSAIQDPGLKQPDEGFMADATRFIHGKPLLHFVASEFWAGIASLMVYAFFVMVSYAIEMLTASFPLKYTAPAHFLDMVFAWGAAFSGGLTFLMITICSVFRLGRQLLRQTY